MMRRDNFVKRRRWENNIKVENKSNGCEAVESIQLALDRDGEYAPVHIAMKRWIP